MIGNIRFRHWFCGAVILALAECAAVVAISLAFMQPVQAQRADDRYPFLSRQRSRGGGGGFFGWFGGGGEGYFNNNQRSLPSEPREPQVQVESSHAPPPRKPDANAPPTTTSIVVLGDGMADWLAYGLEDAFSDSPEVGIVRKNKFYSGLLRYDAKSDLDWWHVARDLLAQEKPNYIVMMLGVSDRQNIRERDLAKEAEKDAKAAKDAKKDGDQKTKQQTEDQDQNQIVAPEPPPSHVANGVIEFRSDKWAEIYSKRIDETIAALKSKGVPVFWVGLPSIRGTKSTADVSYLNDLYRARAERAGINYIDVWDGFVDESGKYSNYGPDYEGQMRRLRASDGVFFTKSGARKLAHYVEREIRRYMSNKVPVAFPSGPVAPMPDAKSKVRPVAGPVVPLTVSPGSSEELVGSGNVQPLHADATADRVLMKGEPMAPPPGRADDFVWPPGSDSKNGGPAASSAPSSSAVARTEPVTIVKPPESSRQSEPKVIQTTPAKPKPDRRVETKQRPQHSNVPRPPADIPSRATGWFR